MKLRPAGISPLEQLHMLLETDDMQAVDYLRKRASEKAHETYGNQVFIRGLIEFTNYCKNDCLYCGIRHSNTHADRYRLSTEQIMACCESGYELGFRTFVLQEVKIRITRMSASVR